MTIKKLIKEIRKLLDALPEKKTDKDRLYLLFKVKLMVDVAEEPIKRRMDKKQVAYDKKTKIIKKALKQFVTSLDKIYDKHEEIGDTDVRDQMYKAIYRNFIQPHKGYSLPQRFGMFSDQANTSVYKALNQFLKHPEVSRASRILKTPEDRFAAFQDDDAKTSKETTYIDYFGCSNRLRVA